MQFDKSQLQLYAVTDRAFVGRYTLYEQIEQALKGGVTCLQLREKNMPQDEFLDEAISVRELCHKYNVPLIINDNLDIAIKSGADGIHVGVEDVPVREIRKIAGNDFIIGATAKTVEQAKIAEREGANYLGVGAVFPSPTKKNAIRITNDMLNEICGSVDIPAVAIGGITEQNIHTLKGSNINGVAVVSAIFGADDIEKTSRILHDTTKKMFVRSNM